MNLHELAVETAEKQAASEAEAFEQATSCIVPAEFKVNDEVEQAFRAGLTARKSCCDDLRIEQIAAHYGFTSQADMAIEECSELIQAICKLRRGYSENHYTNLLEEIADVYIMVRQLRYLLGYSTIDSIVNDKLNRQLKRIEGDDNGV
jgi:NTP pyrophosphatase (non-canonical NTP hydrolase)